VRPVHREDLGTAGWVGAEFSHRLLPQKGLSTCGNPNIAGLPAVFYTSPRRPRRDLHDVALMLSS
jgi:hypothetical protein